MIRFELKPALAAICILVTSSVSVLAQQPAGNVQQFLQTDSTAFARSGQILGLADSHCGHVMDLMMKNRMRERLGTNGTEQLHLPHLTVGMTPGDLELLGINLVADGDCHNGPIFQISMRNNSQVPIGNFRVSIVGVLGQICLHSPTADACIDRMEACEEKHIQIQLPLTCMSMGPVHQPVAFDTLVVALDSDDCLMECDELNNLHILKRCDIVSLVTVAPEAPSAPAETVPDVQGLPPAAPQVPGQPTPPSDDEIDVDKLELGSVHNLRLEI